MQRTLFLLVTIISIHLLASLSMAGNGTNGALRIGKIFSSKESNSEQIESNLELLRKRVDELEKKVEKLVERSKPGVRRIELAS
ncbi:MAG: hypothetical protein GX267_01745 [Fibrobacter sp.]|jgi:hypothetical protein|nr:hypothetical protein [Fibrobacter sp.]